MKKPTLGATILPFDLTSYEAVFALWQRTPGIGLSSADSRANIAVYLARNPRFSFIAQEKDQIVGAILGGHDGRRGYIHHLAVDPQWRRLGIGSLLVEHVISALREAGIQKCHLFIFHENEDGKAFWRDLGWTFRTDVRVMSKHT